MPHGPRHHRRTLPAFVPPAFTAWMVAWVAIILANTGPQNFWWLCNLAQFIVLYSVWRDDRLLLSSQAGTVVLVGLVWGLDLFAGLLLGASPTGTTAYMFNPELSLAHRLSSTYHLWLPVFILWVLHRRGYDRRGPWLQCGIGSALIVGGWWFGDRERNLNYVHAPFGIEQTWMPDALWIPLLCLATAVLVYLPGHFLVRAVLALRAR
jgi:hypothetical protein